MVKFKKEELKKIEAKIAEIEMNTTGEIVVRVVGESHYYAETLFLMSLLGLFVATLGLVCESFAAHWDPPLTHVGFCQIVGLVVGFLLSLVPPVKRLFVHKSAVEREVFQAARSEFLLRGVHRTKDRTGILIFVCLFERRVVILGDEGIHLKVGEAHWQDSVAAVVAGIKAGSAATGLLTALSLMGEKLITHFPGKNTPDELSNSVIIDPL